MKTIRQFLDDIGQDKVRKNLRWEISSERELLEQAGYYCIDAVHVKPWAEVHQWCNDYIGSEHYTWTGHTFWFDDPRNLALFILRWY